MSTVPACSALSLHVPMAGSAPLAQRWWLIESSGAWGTRPVADSHVEWIRQWAARSGSAARVVLIRRAGSHPVRTHDTRQVFTFAPGDQDVMTAQVHDPTADTQPRFAQMDLTLKPSDARWQVASVYPRFLVWTNGKRDLCCAREGRALLNAWDSLVSVQDDVWECTHLGGHRFAPTGLAVPSGYVLGRISPDVKPWAHDGSDPLTPAEFIRGRSDLDAAAQVADVAVRRTLGFDRFTDITSCAVVEHRSGNAYAPLASSTVEVTDYTGNRWHVHLREEDVDHVVASCGSPGEHQRAWVAIDIESTRS